MRYFGVAMAGRAARPSLLTSIHFRDISGNFGGRVRSLIICRTPWYPFFGLVSAPRMWGCVIMSGIWCGPPTGVFGSSSIPLSFSPIPFPLPFAISLSLPPITSFPLSLPLSISLLSAVSAFSISCLAFFPLSSPLVPRFSLSVSISASKAIAHRRAVAGRCSVSSRLPRAPSCNLFIVFPALPGIREELICLLDLFELLGLFHAESFVVDLVRMALKHELLVGRANGCGGRIGGHTEGGIGVE